jgi:hypothetical protein
VTASPTSVYEVVYIIAHKKQYYHECSLEGRAEGSGAGLLAVLGGLGDSDGLAFGAELDPGLDGLLSLSGGRIHFSIPWLGGLQTSCAMSTLNNSPQIINIS